MSQIDLGRQGKDHTIGTPEYQDNTIPSSAIKTSTVNIANGLVTLDDNGKLPTLEGSSLTNLPPAGQLATTSTSVNVSNAVPPSVGQVLTATNATHATWQAASGGITGSGTADKLVKWTGISTVGNSQITDSSSGITVQAQSGQPVNIIGGANGVGSGGNVTIAGGPASGSNPGGGLTLHSGTGQGNGNLSIYTPETLSAPGLTSYSGSINLTSGDAKNIAGDILLTAGKGVGGSGPANDGSITLQLTTANYGTLGNINLNPASSQVVVNGALAVKDGTQTAGYVFTSDSNGVGSWQASSVGVLGSGTPNRVSRWDSSTTLGDSQIVDNGNNVSISVNGTFGVVSIGALTLDGPIRLPQGSPSAGKVLTALNGSGDITWKTPAQAVWRRYSINVSAVGGSSFNQPIPTLTLSGGMLLRKMVLRKSQDGSIAGTPDAYTVSIGTSTDATRYTQAYDLIPATTDNNAQITNIDTIESFGVGDTQAYITVFANGTFTASNVQIFLYVETQSLLLAEII